MNEYYSEENFKEKLKKSNCNQDFKHNDGDYYDVESSLEDTNEDLLSCSHSEYGDCIVGQIQAKNEEEFLNKCCHLIAMTQPEGDNKKIVANIYMRSPKLINVEEVYTQTPMEDIHKPEMSFVLLANLSMMHDFAETTN